MFRFRWLHQFYEFCDEARNAGWLDPIVCFGEDARSHGAVMPGYRRPANANIRLVWA